MSTRPSPAPFKRSIDGLFNVWLNLRSQGHEKPLRNALYNVLVIFVLAAIVGVGFVLAPFMKPLLWAFLFGAVLFPAKKKLSANLNKWIEIMDVEEKPILICVLLAPIQGIDNLGHYLTEWLLKHLKFMVIAFGILGTLRLLIWIAPAELFMAIWNFIVWSHTMFANLLSSLSIFMILVILVTYTLSVFLIWTPDLHSYFMLIGQILWVLVIGYFCSFLSALQVPVFLALMFYGFLGILYNIKTEDSNDSIIEKCKSLLEVKKFHNLEESKIETEEERIEKLNEIKSKLQLNMQSTPISTRNGDNTAETESFMNCETLDSDVYFKILFYACGLTIIWKHTWLVFLLLIPVVLYGLKMLAYKLGIVYYVTNQIQQYYVKTTEWIKTRHSALLPVCLPGVLKINTDLHRFFCSKLKSYIDDLSSIVMIGFLIVLVVFMSVFSFIQIYSEAIAVAQLASNLVNRTLTHKPELIDMLPVDMNSMDDIIDNAYKYGRSNIELYVDGIFNDTDPAQAKKLKSQILSVWDRLIQSWMDRNNGEHVVGPRVTSQSIILTIDEIFVNTITTAGVIGWVKSNIGMLMEVADSLWILVRTNVSLLASAFGTLFSAILGGGHAVIKFLFHTIIFFTTLFYLLQCSQDRYAPVDFNINVSWGQRFAKVFEDSISSVLVATLKLALFHGLFTWLTHTIFGAHVIYLPAVLASILAAAPFLETYWCSLPAFLDLWLSQDRFWLGVILVLIHFIVPSNFNPIIHSEIKGGSHPYLTCLSIAGGIWLIGLEGTILGPLLLCLLVVLFDVTVCAINDSPSPQTR